LGRGGEPPPPPANRALFVSLVCGHLPLARGPFSFSRTPNRLFWSLALRVRTIISASGTFSIACVAHVIGILSNMQTSARRARTFYVRADLLSLMGGPVSLARGPFSFISTSSGLSVHSRFACGPFSPRTDRSLLLA